MARLDYSGESCELSWSVAAGWRRRGVGREIVRQAMGRVRGAVPLARIKRQNDASTRIVISLGFIRIEQDGDVVSWQGPPPTAR
jgi:L-amino acid N-acyltransferase YncA